MSGIDPIFLEVLWNRLLSVVNEQQAALMRTAFSTIVRETQDLACGVFNTQGAMVAQSLTGTPGHINAMATGMRHLLAEYPPERLVEGDVLVTNDPWMTAGQINDITVATPVFRRGMIVGYFANTCHAADIGGRILSAEAREVYEEGLRLPIMKLFRAGEINRDLIRLIRANVRTPDETVGDLYAQTTSNEVGARALLEFMDEFGLDSIDPVAGEIMDRSEEAMRRSIETIPNGRYEHETWSDGFEAPIRIKVAVTVEDRDIHIDFAGSSPQSRRGINVVFNYTHAYASFAMKAAANPEVPHNEGAFRPVHVSAPEGSILNCQPPAAVASRHILGHFLPGVIFGALAEALPLMATGSDPIWISVWRGRPADREDLFTFSLFQCGGGGARAGKDGLSATGFPSGVAGVPAEALETLSSLIQHRRELRADSGGPGRFRGGLGQYTEMGCRTEEAWTVSAMVDRINHPPEGMLGGGPGARGELLLDGRESGRPKALLTLRPDQRVQLNLPGGGGFGDPLDRDPAMVLADVVEGYVSIAGAERDYGVVIRYTGPSGRMVRLPEDYRIDENATEALRSERRGRL
ncbi:MAG: hydantoinase B/oxoprolinase family protein [Acidimicrobiia bacterium]|nr:hydantoinase B/oxoprolinase family protein [Acidimicrobiia bacterium]